MLNKIEDALADAVCSVPGTRFVGRIIRAGAWVFTYYAPRTEGLSDAVGSAMADFPNYSAACDSAEDAEWSRYFRTLLPTHREAQQIRDRRVIANLERHGDSLRTPREVKHWVYFRNPYERSRFAEVTGSLGFELCESELPDDGRRERRFCAVLSRNDPVDFGHIHPIVLTLLDAAREFDGDYDGWETVILRPS